MSDHPSVQDAMSFRVAGQRCNGAPGCPCRSSSTWESGSRTRSSNPSDSGSAAGHSDSTHPTESQESESDAVPEGNPVQEWSGLDSVTIGQCEHGRRAVLKKCTGGRHTGRRFLGCPMEHDEEQCQFKEWLEGPWPERVQRCMKALCREVKTSRRCESNANNSLIEALQIKELAMEANDNLSKKLQRTKKTAHAICKYYHTKAGAAQTRAGVLVRIRNKLIKLVYCLLGVIAILVAVIVYMAAK